MNTKIELCHEIAKLEDLNAFEEIYYKQGHRIIDKWLHYFEIYDRHFKKYQNQPVYVLEIGVQNGGSLQMWKRYFGKTATIIGVDIDPRVKQLEEDQMVIEIGSQSDRDFWKQLKEKYPKIDILIDDGGHRMDQQIITFEEMYPYISSNGVYLCEDLHTSYWPAYGGGYKKEGSFIEFTKNVIDGINAERYQVPEPLNQRLQEIKKSTFSISYYESVVVLEKRKIAEPISVAFVK